MPTDTTTMKPLRLADPALDPDAPRPRPRRRRPVPCRPAPDDAPPAARADRPRRGSGRAAAPPAGPAPAGPADGLVVVVAWLRVAAARLVDWVRRVRRALTPLDVGIDLGTANTLVFVRGQGVVLDEPSVVAVKTSGARREVVAVGARARAMLGRTPRGVEVHRPLRDGVIADFEVAQDMVEHLLRRVVGPRVVVRPRVVICVPCGATSMERRAIAEAAERTGVRSVALIDEPVAAALGADLPIAEPRGSMVVDVGGGTTEVAVLSLGGVSYAASARVGGDAMDEAIVAWVRQERGVLLGLAAAERLKHEAGAARPPADGGPGSVVRARGLDLVGGLPTELELSERDVAESLARPVAAIVDAVRQALAQTPPDLAADVAEAGLHLMGGGALLRGLDRVLAEATGLEVGVVDDPRTCVARGTGRALEDASLAEAA